ncbi:hypothetical protein GJ744_010391 [Endocarpon pusillum]|uniref:Uncharacterized protein n=1 Tax=Endocarpon pusillum TaxID=364733 RepID=A0A8H7E3M2_9EURO|nr:hypothetical protein GJ744_010391 [Endocarpon pusillum]
MHWYSVHGPGAGDGGSSSFDPKERQTIQVGSCRRFTSLGEKFSLYEHQRVSHRSRASFKDFSPLGSR